MQLHHVQLAIPEGSEDICRNFYANVLGLIEIPKPDSLKNRGGLWFKIEDLEFHLGVQKDFQPAKKAHPAFILKDVQILANKLENYDFDVLWDTKLSGFKRFFTHDAVGNRLEFLQVL